jgi:hypothetical protein
MTERSPRRDGTVHRGAAALALVSLCCSCGPGSRESSRSTDTSAMSETDSLALSVAAPAAVPRGQPVRLTVVIANRLDRDVTLYLRGREIAFDLVVRSADGTLRWQRLAGAAIPAIVRVEELDPGAERRLEAQWDQRDWTGAPVPPGEYRVEGLVLTDGNPLRTPPTAFRIDP